MLRAKLLTPRHPSDTLAPNLGGVPALTLKAQDLSYIPTHMKRFRALANKRSNRHIIFLHIHLHLSLDQIASATGISRKTVTRLLLGQLPTRRQLKRLQRTVNKTVTELEKLLAYERTSREGMYYGEILHHTISLGRLLGRVSSGRVQLRGE